MPSSLKSLIFTISATILIGLVLLTALNFKHDYDGAIKTAHSQTRHVAQTLSEHAARTFEAIDLVTLHVVDQIQRDMVGQQRSPEEIKAALLHGVNLTPQIRALVVADSNGIETASHTGQGIGVDVSDRDYFKTQRDNEDYGLFVGRPLLGRVTGQWFLSVSRRINNPDGTFGGVALAIISQEYFSDFYQSAEHIDGISSAFVTTKGLVFAASANFAPDASNVTGKSLTQSTSFVAQIDASDVGTLEIDLFENGDDNIVSYQRIKNLPILIVTRTTVDDAILSIFDHFKSIFVVITVTAVVLTFLLITTVQQIRQREETERQLRHMANHDLLTNLPNRRQGIDHLNRALANAHRRKSEVAVMFVDLDGFKAINDDFGHEAGDTVLVTISQRFLDSVRLTDVVARLGGDEFLIILTDLTDETVLPRIAEKILGAANEPIDINNIPVSLSASIGIALYPRHGEDADTLINTADETMYRAKEAGKNAFRVAEVPTHA